MDVLSLLPPNASEFERALEQATAFMDNMPVPIRQYWHPDTIPVQQAPWLAWEWSVDSWDSQWPEQTKRSVMRDSFRYHRIKGTLRSVEEAIRALGSNIAVREWWQQEPAGTPYTFDAVVDAGAGDSSGVLQEQLINAINQAKPVRCHYELTVSGKSESSLNIYGYARCGRFQRLYLSDG